MKPLVKPSISMLAYNSTLDALATHASGAVRVATDIFVRTLKLPAHATRMPEATGKLLRGLGLLSLRVTDVANVVNHSTSGVQLVCDTVLSEALSDPGRDQPIANWSKRHPAYAAALEIPADDDESLVAFAAAYVVCQFTGKSFDATFARKLARDAASSQLGTAEDEPSTRRWFADHQRHLETLRRLARGTLGESDVDFQRDACSCFIWRSKLPGRNDRDGLVHDRCLTPDAFEESAAFLRIGLVEGQGLATAIASGWLSGLTWPLVKRIPLKKPEGDDWAIWLDIANGCYWVNLNPVARNAAVSKGNLNYIAATKEFARYLPAEVASALQRLDVIRPESDSLGVLTDTTDVPEEHVIGEATDHVLKPSIARFFNTRSSVSKQLKLSGPITALAIGDLARVAHSRFYYHSTTPHQLEEALSRVAKLLGWGPIRSFEPEALMIGATVVPSSETIAAIARELADNVLSAQPPRHYNWEHVRKFHNALANYVAFLVGLGVMGRARDATVLVGAISAVATGLAGLHDKRTPSSKGATSVAVCKQVREQLAFWFTHLEFLLGRMDKCSEKLQFLRNRIQAILDGQSASIVFSISDRGLPFDVGTTHAYASVSDELQVKADSARHLWERYFSEEQIDDKLAEAQARRNVHWSDFWHETTRLSGARLRRVIGALQERVLSDLGIRAIRGLVK